MNTPFRLNIGAIDDRSLLNSSAFILERILHYLDATCKGLVKVPSSLLLTAALSFYQVTTQARQAYFESIFHNIWQLAQIFEFGMEVDRYRMDQQERNTWTMSLNNLLPIDKTGLEPRAASPRFRTDPKAFKALLEGTLRNEAEGSTSAVPPLSKAQLMDIVNNVRMQMDARLMQAFTSESREDTGGGYPGLMNRLTTPPPDSSNRQHVDQKIDAPDSRGPNASDARGRIDAAIREAAQTHGVDPALVRSVIKAESDFNPNSTSPKGAMGLMQLMPETARELGVKNGYDPVENIGAGTRYLKMLLNRYEGDVPLALAAYNWGMGNIEKRPGQMPAETRRYVDQVTRQYAALKA